MTLFTSFSSAQFSIKESKYPLFLRMRKILVLYFDSQDLEFANTEIDSSRSRISFLFCKIKDKSAIMLLASSKEYSAISHPGVAQFEICKNRLLFYEKKFFH